MRREVMFSEMPNYTLLWGLLQGIAENCQVPAAKRCFSETEISETRVFTDLHNYEPPASPLSS